MKTDKRNTKSRLWQDVNKTSRTMQPNLGSEQGPHRNPPTSKAKDSNTEPDWHNNAMAYTQKGSQGKENNNDSRK